MLGCSFERGKLAQASKVLLVYELMRYHGDGLN